MPDIATRTRDQALTWTASGTRRFEHAARGLDPAEIRQATRLAGWQRGHVLTHVARNADALRNLLVWARTGVETPMYATPQQRTLDIAAGAGRPAAEIVDDLLRADAALAEAIESLPAAAWDATVRTARGREVPAAEVAWLRAREVWVHAVDLLAGVGMADLPDDFVAALSAEVVGDLAARYSGPPVLLAPVDGAGLSLPGRGDPVEAVGPAAQLLGWLIGRDFPDVHTKTGALPPLPAWL